MARCKFRVSAGTKEQNFIQQNCMLRCVIKKKQRDMFSLSVGQMMSIFGCD